MLQLPIPTRRAHASPNSAGPTSTNSHGRIFLQRPQTLFQPRLPKALPSIGYNLRHLSNHVFLRHSRGSAMFFYQSSRQHLPTLRHGLALLRPFSTTYTHHTNLISNHVSTRTPTARLQPVPSCFPTVFLRHSHGSVTTSAIFFSKHVFHSHYHS